MDERAAITYEDLERGHEAFAGDRANVVARNAVTSKGLRAVARVPEAAARSAMTFDVEVRQGERCDQKRTGRCWMFASLNVLRQQAIVRHNLKSLELSQAYPLFFDKLEKSNWFLENVIDTRDEELSGRLVSFLLADPVADGGQWDMFRALLDKYGAVPKEAMPETTCSSNTSDLDRYLTRHLRGCARRLRETAAAGAGVDELREMKREMLREVDRMLRVCLGEPPERFDVRLRDKDDELVVQGTFTPREFLAEVVGVDFDSWVSLISAPTADKPFGRTYTVERLGNVAEAGGVRYLNLPIDELKRAALTQLSDGVPVWFGCDVDQSFLHDDGIMDTAALDVDSLFGFPVEGAMGRAERLDYGESVMTHAMVLEGANLDAEGRPTMWKVENSWGDSHGRKGFDVMTDAWFDEYVYQVVVDRRYLTEEQRRAFDECEPVALAPWDPMGALAR